MPKTQFIDKNPGLGQEGTPVTAEFLNSLFYTSGGHVHDGGTEDGSAAQVDLASHVTGQLPASKTFDSGRKLVFFEAAAPTGWTQDATHNNKALRVVSGAGAGSGGTHGLSTPPSTSHTHTTGDHTLVVGELAVHSHTTPVKYAYINLDNPSGAELSTSGTGAVFSTNSSGGGGAHNHGSTGSNGPTAFSPLYIDVIVCTKN